MEAGDEVIAVQDIGGVLRVSFTVRSFFNERQVEIGVDSDEVRRI